MRADDVQNRMLKCFDAQTLTSVSILRCVGACLLYSLFLEPVWLLTSDRLLVAQILNDHEV